VDYYWDKLSEGGEKSMCGWLKDKFGLSWQVVPNALGTMLQDKDPAKAGRAMEAMMKMSKLDIAALEKAFEGS
jgi:predicted 3-demethylubiquinone-9 3-methyltransferase (glyoxalase superfamily)